MLAEVPEELGSDREASQTLLQEARVAAVPGSAFFSGDGGSRMLRFCFAKDMAVLEEACRRLRAFRPAAIA
jgi:aminotransferase